MGLEGMKLGGREYGRREGWDVGGSRDEEGREGRRVKKGGEREGGRGGGRKGVREEGGRGCWRE